MKKKNLGYFLIAFLAGIFLGVMFVNLLGNTYIERTGLFSDYFFRQYQDLAVNCDQVFFFVFKKRMKSILFIWFMGLTSAGAICTLLYSGYLGCMAGIVVMTAILRMGWKGILIIAVSLIPQIFIYAPILTFFLNEVYEKGIKRRNMHWVHGRREIEWRYGVLLIAVLLFFFLGIVLESYVNPVLLQYILRKI